MVYDLGVAIDSVCLQYEFGFSLYFFIKDISV